jgi:hypothetical protein
MRRIITVGIFLFVAISVKAQTGPETLEWLNIKAKSWNFFRFSGIHAVGN